MTAEEWEELRRDFRRYVVHRGDRTVADVAQELGINRDTVYALLKDPERQPHRLTRDAIRRALRASDTRQPDDDA